MMTKDAPFARCIPWFDCVIVPTRQISHANAQCKEQPRPPSPHPPGPDQVTYLHVRLQGPPTKYSWGPGKDKPVQ